MPTLFMMIGAPGSGKSYFAKEKLRPLIENCDYVSRDEIRFSLMKDGDVYFAHERETYNIFIKSISDSLMSSRNVIADAIHINWPSRRKLINNLKKIINLDGIDVVPVMVSCSRETALKRNSGREGLACVPDNVITTAFDQMTDPANDPFKYSAILRVRNE